MVTQAMNSPQVCFVERAGNTVIVDLGRNSPWASEWYCPRKDCLPCQGRAILAAKAEKEAMAMVSKDSLLEKKTKSADRKSLPSCIGEGTNYSIECLTCRKEEGRRIYMGETLRSTYQRGKDH